MEKKITVHRLVSNEVSKVFPSKNAANKALALLESFGYTGEVVTEKQSVTIK